MRTSLWQRLLPFLTLIALFIGLIIATPNFFTSTNLSSVVRQTAVINIMALGMTMVIITGGIDLSVGSILALAGCLGTMTMTSGFPVLAGIAVGVLTGCLAGLLNGALTTRLRINPFIVTLGTLLIIRGFALILTNGMPVQNVPKEFSFLGEGSVAGVPFVLLLLLIIAGAVHVILEHTKLGRYAFAIGSNPDAAFYAGIPVRFHTTVIYGLCGLLTGLAGMIESSRLMTGQPTAGQGYELPAIAAVVIGGGSLRGGEGGVVGTLIGAFIMGLLSNGCDLLGIQPFVQQATIGAVIILAVSVDELRKRKMV
ncbi:MAG: ABC transporter permease [Bryobacteraceae bacterium]|nr:ABC transporter permease [Bryobacteraceae bacterium]